MKQKYISGFSNFQNGLFYKGSCYFWNAVIVQKLYCTSRNIQKHSQTVGRRREICTMAYIYRYIMFCMALLYNIKTRIKGYPLEHN